MSDELNIILQGQSGPGDTIYFRALYYLHSRIAEMLTELASEEDMPMAAWSVNSVDQLPFSALAERYQANSVWGIVDFAEQPGGVFLLGTNEDLISLVGAHGPSDDAYARIDALMQRICDTFKESWSDIQDFEPQLGTFPMTPSLGELQEIFTGLVPQTPIISTTFRATAPAKTSTRIVLAVPVPYLIPLGSSLEAAAEAITSHNSGENVEERLAQLEDVPTSLVVTLGTTVMTVSELQNLEEDDVIVLDQAINSPLRVTIGKGGVVSGKPGTSPDGTRRAIQITSLERE